MAMKVVMVINIEGKGVQGRQKVDRWNKDCC